MHLHAPLTKVGQSLSAATNAVSAATNADESAQTSLRSFVDNQDNIVANNLRARVLNLKCNVTLFMHTKVAMGDGFFSTHQAVYLGLDMLSVASP